MGKEAMLFELAVECSPTPPRSARRCVRGAVLGGTRVNCDGLRGGDRMMPRLRMGQGNQRAKYAGDPDELINYGTVTPIQFAFVSLSASPLYIYPTSRSIRPSFHHIPHL